MARRWICEQCGQSDQGGVLPGGEPDECEHCGNDQFRELGSTGTVGRFLADPTGTLEDPRTRRRLMVGTGTAVLAGGAVWWSFLRPDVEETNHVAMKDGRFDPKNVEIDAGETVTWTNEATAPEGNDPPTYTLASATDNWDLEEELEPGESTSYTFEEGGQYAAYVHDYGSQDLEGMAMKIGVGEAVEDPIGT